MAQTASYEASMIARSDALVGTLGRAADYAAGQSHPAVTLEHLLLALTEDGDAAGVLEASSVDLARLRNEVAGFIGQQPPSGPMRTSPVPDAELTKILTYAEAAARQSGRSEINGAIVLAAILGEGRSMAATLLKAQGLTFQAAIKIIQQVLAPTPPPAAPAAEAAPAAAPPGAEPADETPPAAPEGFAEDRAVLADRSEPQRRTPPPAEPISRAPIPEVQRAQREVLGIPSIRPDPPPRPPAPRPQPQPPRKAAEPEPVTQAAPAPAPPPKEEVRSPAPEPAPPPPAPPAPVARPSPAPPRTDATPRTPVPPPPAALEPRHPAPSIGDPMPAGGARPVPPGTTVRPPPLPAREPAREPVREQARPPAGPPPIPAFRPGEPVPEAARPAAGPPPPAGGLGAPRPPPPRPGLRLPPNPLEGHQITAPWPEPTNDYRPPVPPPGYPARAPAARAPRTPPPPPGRQSTVEKGQLVENIPRRMKVGVAETFEIRIAREGVMEVGQAMPGRAEPQFHAIRITRAMSVRLKGEPGRFYIEAASPETQWTGAQNDQLAGDYAVWRFTVIPQVRGPADLTLIVAARSIGSDGVIADTSLPEQRITVRVSANVTRGLRRWVTWLFVAVLGGVIAKLGESFWEPVLALIRQSIAM